MILVNESVLILKEKSTTLVFLL